MTTSAQIPDINTLSPDQITHIPFSTTAFYERAIEFYAQAHAEGVRYSPVLNAYVISRYADVEAALKDERFSHAYHSDDKELEGDPALALFYDAARYMFFFQDTEAHRKARPPASPLFAPSHVKYLEPMIEKGANEIIDGIIERHKEDRQFNFLYEFAFPMPIYVICQLLGIEESDPMKMVTWVYQFMGGYGVGQPVINKLIGAAAMAQMYAYFYPLVTERTANPGNDYISKLANLKNKQGEKVYTTAQVIYLCINMILGGFETAASTLSTGLPLFLTRPEQWAELGQNPALGENAAEELLRLTAVVRLLTRQAMEDAEVGGVNIPKGARIAIFPPAANHDETVYENPTVFDMMRQFKKRVMTFGTGPHICLGEHLGRLEITVAVRVLAQRFPGLYVVSQKLRELMDVSGVDFLNLGF